MINQPLLLDNRIQDYPWGSRTAIQNLLGKTPDGNPWAELWMGAHPKAPSRVTVGGEAIDLDRFIRQFPEPVLGPKTAREYENTLPYLFKVLAAGEPLSIQAHPDTQQAAEGFYRENRLGIPVGAKERNYRDPWPKPEVICALEPFIALNGFRPADAIIGLIGRFCSITLRSELGSFAKNRDSDGLRTLFRTLLTLPDARRDAVIAETIGNGRKIDSEEARWVIRLGEYFPGDIGILAPLLLNLIRLEPGEAMFLPPGRMHAYLSGTGIELMANSDNVLRGGLTRKHIDVDELTRVLRFEPTPVEIISPVEINSCEQRYPLEVEEFALSVIRIDSRNPYAGPENHSAEILLCQDGRGEMIHRNLQAPLSFLRGNAVLIPAAADAYRVEGNARIYKASIPV